MRGTTGVKTWKSRVVYPDDIVASKGREMEWGILIVLVIHIKKRSCWEGSAILRITFL